VCAVPPTRLSTPCCFSRPAYRPPRHSFPTRRSSDLPTTHPASWRCSRRVAGDGPGLLHDGSTSASGPLPAGGSGPDVRLDGVGTDRKSTRLNSSHVSISYAVFCLKKKTRKSIVTTEV